MKPVQKRFPSICLAAALLLAAPAVGAQDSSVTGALTTTQTVLPVADSYVSAAKPNTNYGPSQKLRVQGAQSMRSYVRFDLRGLGGTVTNADLSLYSTSASSGAFEAHAVSDSGWDERSVTYANAPAVSPTVLASSAPASRKWSKLDVTSAVTAGGVVTIALTPGANTDVTLSSRETGTNPVLVVETTTDDTTAPSVPQGLTVTAVTATSVSVSWSPSNDDVGVGGYGLYRNGTLVGSTPETSYTFAGFSCGMSSTVGVDAYDLANNRSGRSSVSVTTSACADTQPPTAPAPLLITATSATTISLSWSPSTDEVGVVGYGLYRDGTLVGSTREWAHTFEGLSCGRSYTLAVDAYDAAGNRSAKTSVVVATSACAPPPASGTVPRGAWTDSNVTPGELDVFASLGFNMAQVDPDRTQLDLVRSKGLRAIVWLGNINDSSCVWNWSDATLRARIEAVRGHPAIAYYFIADEPHAGCAQRVRERTQLVKSLDPTVPTFITENRREDFDELAGIADVFGIIRYPCSYSSGCVMAKISESVAAARAAGITSWWGVPQAFYEPSGYYRAPTPAEQQQIIDTWKAEGAQALFVYTWGRGCCGDDVGLADLPNLFDTWRAENAG